MGDAQRLSPDEQIRSAKEAFENGRDHTVAVEEEFAILDPETLGLVNRFEELEAAARGSDLEEHLVGELIASEIEVRTGRCETFADAAALMGERRRQLRELAARFDVALCAAGTHPWSPWQEQRIIDTPHYRRNDEVLRYVVWRNNSFGLHVHVGIRGADRAIAVTNGLRAFLPHLLAYSGSSPFVEGVYTHLHSARTQIFTRMFPRCGVPDVRGLGRVRAIRPLSLRHGLDHRAHAALVERAAASGLPDGGDPDLRRPARAGRGPGARRAHVRADGAHRFSTYGRSNRLALDEGEPLPDHPHRLIEENFWRAIRHGLSGELIDLDSGEVRPARAELERLLEWALPVAEELGVAPFLTVPAVTSAERQMARHEAGESMEAVYAQEVLEPVRLVTPK